MIPLLHYYHDDIDHCARLLQAWRALWLIASTTRRISVIRPANKDSSLAGWWNRPCLAIGSPCLNATYWTPRRFRRQHAGVAAPMRMRARQCWRKGSGLGGRR